MHHWEIVQLQWNLLFWQHEILWILLSIHRFYIAPCWEIFVVGLWAYFGDKWFMKVWLAAVRQIHLYSQIFRSTLTEMKRKITYESCCETHSLQWILLETSNQYRCAGHRAWTQKAWILFLALLLLCCVTLGKPLLLLGPQFSLPPVLCLIVSSLGNGLYLISTAPSAMGFSAPAWSACGTARMIVPQLLILHPMRVGVFLLTLVYRKET